jgi:glycosyltransferase involved in cell wall biosynthesis
MKPDISIVIPLYNKERYIRRAIDSVLRQSFRNFECIVVDSSTDGSTGIVRTYDDRRIILIPCEKSTAARARNLGVSTARSDLIAFLDADDEWQTDHLETLNHLHEQFPDAGLLSTPYIKLKPDGSPRVMLFCGIPPPPWEGYLPGYLSICSKGDEPVHSSSVAVPREVFGKMGGFPETLVYSEDQFLWGKISLAYPVAFSWKGLAVYHTEALGRICEESHPIREHAFSAYLRQELEAGRIPRDKIKECRNYIRKKGNVELFARFLYGDVPDECDEIATGASPGIVRPGKAGKPGSVTQLIGGSLGRFYHSSVHDFIRRIIGILYRCYIPELDSSSDKEESRKM